jgi:O-antigen ligase
LFCLYQHFQSIQLGNNPESIKIGLLNATFKDALSFGAFLGIILPVMLGICLAFRGTLRVLSFLILILSGYLALFTGSKSLVVSLPVSLLVFLALGLPSFRLAIRPKKIKGRPIHWSTVIVGVLIVLILLGLAVSREFVAREISASNTLSRFDRFEALLNYRAMTLWKLAVEMIKDYPLTGVGIGAYIIEVSNYAQIHKIRVIAESAENYMLQVTSELGFIGLFLILWILVEIFKAIRHGFRRIPPSDPLRYILVGCTAGLAAFIIIVQSHTFIGSYEIKYTAWLLVGLMALSGRKDKDIEPRPKSSRSSKMAGGVLLIVFAVGSLWTSTHSLSLENRTALFGLKQNFGFYQAEKDKEGREFRWSNTPAGLSLKVSKPVMEFPLLASHPDIGEKPVTVRIYLVKDLSWKKRRLDEITLDRIAWQVRRYSLAQEVNQEVILLFEVSRTWNPQKMKGIHDQRNLGIAIGKIQFKDP